MSYFLSVLFALANASPSSAAMDYGGPNYSRTSIQAFQCLLYARDSERPDSELNRLFDIGVDAGRRFIAQLEDGELSVEWVDKEAPIGWRWVLPGISADFAIGRLYEIVAADHQSQLEMQVVLAGIEKFSKPAERFKSGYALEQYKKEKCSTLTLDAIE